MEMFVEYFARKTCLFHFLLMFHATHAVTPRYELPGRPFHPITVFRSNQERMKGKRANPSVRPYSQGTPLELVLDTVCSSPCTVWGCFSGGWTCVLNRLGCPRERNLVHRLDISGSFPGFRNQKLSKNKLLRNYLGNKDYMRDSLIFIQ